MIPVAPAAFASLIAPSTAFVAPVENCSSRIIATSRPGTIDQVTSGRSNWRRVIVTSKSAVPSRPIVSVTGSPSGPRTRETTSSTVWPSVFQPSTEMMRSPRRSSDSSAGVLGMIELTVGAPPSSVSVLIWTPMPTNVPDSDWSAAGPRRRS